MGYSWVSQILRDALHTLGLALTSHTQIHYVALVGCVNRSILQVEFGDGFHVNAWPTEKFISFYKEMNGSDEYDILFKMDEEWGYGIGGVYRPKTVFVIEKILPQAPVAVDKLTPTSNEWRQEFSRRMAFEHDQSTQLQDKINKLRLCASGSIKICVEFFYFKNGKSLELQASTEERLHSTNRLFKVRKGDLPNMTRLLQQPPLARTQKYLTFALENYSQSYRVAQIQLEFITLMLALEAIFNDGKQELRNKVSRGCAVLLGRSKENSRQVFKDIKDLYDKRSVLVHTGDISKIKEADVQQLHAYVRQSLARAVVFNFPKEKFSALLQESGFGQRESLARHAKNIATPSKPSVALTRPTKSSPKFLSKK